MRWLVAPAGRRHSRRSAAPKAGRTALRRLARITKRKGTMRKFLRFIGAAVLSGLLAACGGGGDAPGVALQPQGSGTVISGTVTGFGSVIIDGVRYPESAPTVAHDVDGRSEVAGTMASVKVGQQ